MVLDVPTDRLDLVARYLHDSRLREAEVQSETMAKENLGRTSESGEWRWRLGQTSHASSCGEQTNERPFQRHHVHVSNPPAECAPGEFPHGAQRALGMRGDIGSGSKNKHSQGVRFDSANHRITCIHGVQ